MRSVQIVRPVVRAPSFIFAVLAGCLLFSSSFLFDPTPAFAFSQGEGTGTQWCGAYGGTNLGSVNDAQGVVYACELTSSSPTAGETPFNPGYPYFQCTELANRYLYNFNGDTEFDSSYNDDNLVGGNFVSSSAALETSSACGEDRAVNPKTDRTPTSPS
jgi:hypothetical protein